MVGPEAVPHLAGKAVRIAAAAIIALLLASPAVSDEIDEVLGVETMTPADGTAEALMVEALQAKELELQRMREEVRELQDTIRRLVRARSGSAVRVERIEPSRPDTTPRDPASGGTPEEQYSHTEKACLEVLKQDPDDADAHYNLGILYEDYIEKPERAKHHYREFLRVAPDGPVAAQVHEWLISLP